MKSFAECEILSEWKFGRNKNSKQGIVCHKSTIFVKLYVACKGTPLEPRWANKKKKVERADAEDTRKNKTPLMKIFRGVTVILILKYQIHSEGILKKFAQGF